MRKQSPERTHRRRLSKEEYQKKKWQSLLVSLVLAIVPFALLVTGLSLMTIGALRYVEQETVVGLLLTKRVDGDISLHGVGWNATPTKAPLPSETSPEPGAAASPQLSLADKYQQAAIQKKDRLIAPFYPIGAQLGSIRIASVKIDVKVFQGDTEQEFRQGAGHYTPSLLPGQGGNILIAGHRTSYFRSFEYLKIGDVVTFETTYGTFTYRIREFKIIKGNDVSVAKPTPQEQLTMYTCYPFTYVGNAPKRYVVMCDLVEKEVRT